MPKYTTWVLDASMGVYGDGCFCFCPYDEATGDILTGMNLISDRPPGRLVGVVHRDGQDAADRWCAEHEDELNAMEEADHA